MHWQSLFIDRSSMAIGSFNPTNCAKHHNYENSVLIEGINAVRPMIQQFDKMFERGRDIRELFLIN